MVYFPGANTYYQACFRDITTAAKETGATIHAFNFPGIGSSTGKVNELNDVINAGIAVVNGLLLEGISPDDIILQGDCYGAGVALEVAREFQKQSKIELRVIMKNAFKSFKAVILDQLDLIILNKLIKNLVKKLLVFTRWHLTPGKHYEQSGPYRCYLQTEQDHTLTASKLAKKVEKYKNEMQTKTINSQHRPPKQDLCPEEYRQTRDELDKISVIKIKKDAIPRLEKKFGTNKKGQVNAHFADLCELEMRDGSGSVYTHFINRYIKASDEYLSKGHLCQIKTSDRAFLPFPLKEKVDIQPISVQQIKNFNELMEHVRPILKQDDEIYVSQSRI